MARPTIRSRWAPPAFLKRVISAGIAAAGAAGDVVVLVAEDVGLGDDAAGERVGDLADVGGAGAAVDEEAGPAQRRVVGLAHVGAVGADQVEVLAKAEPVAMEHRLAGHGRRRDDVGRGDGGGDVVGDRGAGRRGEGLGTGRGAVPERDLDAGEAGAISLDERGGDLAGAEDQQAAGVGAGEQAGAEQRIGGGLPAGDEGGVDHRLDGAGGRVIEHQRALNRGQAPGGVAGEHREALDRGAEALDPGGADLQRVGAAGQEQVAGLRARAAVAGGDRLGDRQPVEPALDVGGGQPGDRRHQPSTAAIALARWSSWSRGRPAMLMRLSPIM